MTRKTIIFCGTPEFAVPSLNALIASDVFEVQLVITQPDKPQGRKQELTSPAVKTAAIEANIPVIQPQSFHREVSLALVEHGIERPDFLVVVAYGNILSAASLAIPTIAPINVHGSLLPRWRGASPIEHALLAGDAETGVTIQVMAEALDAGPVLATRAIHIGPRETSVSLRGILAHLGAKLLVDTLSRPLSPKPQPEEGITVCRKLSKDDGKADVSAMNAEEIDRRVRALNPWPGVTCLVEGEALKLLETSLTLVPDSTPLTCFNGSILHLVTVQPAGKKPMTGGAWRRGKK